MLPSLRIRLSPKAQYLTKLGILTSITHLVVLVAFLFVYRYEIVQHSVAITAAQARTSARIVLLPFQKHVASVPTARENVPGTTHSTAKSPAVAHTVPPKPVPKPAALLKPAPVKKATTVKPIAKTTPKSAPKQTPPAKKIGEKKLAPPKPVPLKPPEPAPKVLEQKTAHIPPLSAPQPLLESPRISEASPAAPDQSAYVAPAAPLAESEAAPITEQAGELILYVGQHDLDALELHDAVAAALHTHWKVPPGLRSNLTCTLRVVLAFDGTLRSCEFEKKSGVLLFDMAAQTAIRATTFPRQSWGKQLTLTF